MDWVPGRKGGPSSGDEAAICKGCMTHVGGKFKMYVAF